MQSSITIQTLQKMKKNKEKIACLTAYDNPFAKIADEAGIHMILVGDSLAMTVQGESHTLGVTMDEMIYHCRIVSNGAQRALVIGDMPFLSYQVSTADAIINAGRFLKESGVSGVKLEGGASVSNIIRAMVDIGIPVLAHIGLLPQSVHQMGGYRVQRDEDRLMADAKEVEAAGAFAVVLEGIPSDISSKITRSLSIPTIGIGAGPDCDGQILVMHDMLGIRGGHVPKFVKQYTNLKESAVSALKTYVQEVQGGEFPSSEHSYK